MRKQARFESTVGRGGVNIPASSSCAGRRRTQRFRLELLESRTLLSLDVYHPQFGPQDFGGLGSVVSAWVDHAVARAYHDFPSLVAIGQGTGSATPFEPMMVVAPRASVPWIVVSVGQSPMLEGVGQPVPYQAAGWDPSSVLQAQTSGEASGAIGSSLASLPASSGAQTTDSSPQNQGDSGSQTGAGGTSDGAMGPVSTAQGASGFVSDTGSALGLSLLPIGPSIPALPDQRDVTYTGSLSGQLPITEVRIPLDPSNQSVNLSLKSLDTAFGSATPVLAGMEIVDSSGRPLELMQSLTEPNPNAPDALTLMPVDGAVNGGTLVLQISTAQAQAKAAVDSALGSTAALMSGAVMAPSPAAAASAAAASSWSVPFSLQVQRLDSQSAMAAAADPAAFTGSNPSSFTFAAMALTGLSSTSTSAPELTPAQEAALQAVSATSFATAPNTTSATLDTETVAAADGWLPTGPLASRSAEPLGLVLAAVLSDPTVGVQRTERAYASEGQTGARSVDEIVERGVESWLADHGLQPIAKTSDAQAQLEREVTISGARRGALPLFVTANVARRPASLQILLAPDSVHTAPQAPIVLDATAAVAAVEPRSEAFAERSRVSRFAKAALGLVVGLTLTTSPIVSDLMHKRRLRRSAAGSGSGTDGGGVAAPSSRDCRSPFGRWRATFRGRLRIRGL